jgi:molybdopterin synthase catalytic subunit
MDSNGLRRIHIRVQREVFDLSAEVADLRAGDAGVGAICTFVGTVRDRHADQSVTALVLEHYPGMTEKAIRAMVETAGVRFGIRSATVIHRVGPLAPLDPIVLVAVSAAHRGEAFAACEFLMDHLKTQAPFWKKETLPDGTARWVDARETDATALSRWSQAAG